jgi:hypothetical protein
MSKIEVNQISSQCGSTLTIGQSGDTVTLAAGATQSGFGQTYSATEFCTTVKTAPFTAVAGKGYFVNTTCGAVTVTLPATPTAGDVVSIKDYARTFGTNNLTVCRNGSKMDGQCNSYISATAGQSLSLIYVDGTKGWTSLQESSTLVGAPAYIVATGGTITCCGNYRIHTFTADGCFAITTAPTPANNKVDYLVVAGGGGSPSADSGGGGAGGFRESYCATTSGTYCASPLASATSLTVTSSTTYPITIGGGGGPVPPGSNGSNGSDSIFSTITSAGGGYGATYNTTGGSGGSGGGRGRDGQNGAVGSGNTPPVSPPQGNPGGTSASPGWSGGGGGGGAGQTGQNGGGGAPGGGEFSGPGGYGVGTQINTSPTIGTPGPSGPLRYFAGGGGGGAGTNSPGATNTGTTPSPGTAGGGGYGGGGNGSGSAATSTSGQANTGGGGGGDNGPGGNSGGSGIVIIRYKYQ